MSKLLRRTLLISLIVVLITITALWLFAGRLLKTAVEQGGSQIVGAKVEVQDAGVSWSPLGIKLQSLKVTNPDKPMENMIEIANLQSDVYFLPLLAGQILIDNLTATGMQFNTTRTTSGAIEKKEKTDNTAETSSFDISSIQQALPSFDEIIGREPLNTPVKAKLLKDKTLESQKNISEKISSLPDQEKLTDYKQQIAAITDKEVTSIDDLAQRKAKLDELKKALKKDKDNILETRDTLKTSKLQLQQHYNELQKAPQEDLSMLRSKYSFDATGASNLTGLLFGDKAQYWFNNLKLWHSKLQNIFPSTEKSPVNEKPASSTGLFALAYDKTLPQFLIRDANMQAMLPMGNINLQIKDITHEPHILGKPIVIKGKGEQLNSVSQINMDGVIDHVNPQKSLDKLNWTINAWQLNNINLSDDNALPMKIKKAASDIAGSIAIADSVLNGNFTADFNDVDWESGINKGWQAEIAQTLTTIKQFKLQGEIKGSVADPVINIKSDLDKKIQNASTAKLKEQQAKLEGKLQDYLTNEAGDASKPYQKYLKTLSDTESTLNERSQQIEEMLKAEVKSALDNKKKEAEKKAEDKLKSKLKGLGL